MIAFAERRVHVYVQALTLQQRVFGVPKLEGLNGYIQNIQILKLFCHDQPTTAHKD